jgi:hypothetical protein
VKQSIFRHLLFKNQYECSILLIFFYRQLNLASARRRRWALSFWHQKETKNAG